ncbi:MAG: ABC transporter permease [Thermodesulfobacteriota bacterium]|nr:ABC transporter permease [Thermodesulfobacteriota bacterium]
MNTIVNFTRFLGRRTLINIRHLGRAWFFLITSFLYLFIPPFKFSRWLKQIRFIGTNSTLIVFLTSFFTGAVLGYHGFFTLKKFGAEGFLGATVSLSLIRELGPVLSALMITGRAGSALASEIGIMRISEQLDSMEIMALNPFRYIITPNLFAGIFTFPLLCSIFDVVGIFGGYLICSKMLGLASGEYFGSIRNYVEFKDVYIGLYKSICFGIIVTWICCYKGFYTGYGAEGVSKATTQAVVISSVLILIGNYFLTSVLF